MENPLSKGLVAGPRWCSSRAARVQGQVFLVNRSGRSAYVIPCGASHHPTRQFTPRSLFWRESRIDVA